MADVLRVALHRRMAVWRRDPCAFARDVFGVEPWERQPWSRGDSQADFLRSILRSRRIAWRSGHKCGKTTGVVVLALWAWLMFPRARVVFTAPTGRQVNEALWNEVTRLYKLARDRGFHLGGRLYETPSKGLRGPDQRQLFGFSTDEKDKFSGISGPWVFYFVDEASGVDEGIFQAIEGNAAGGAWVVLTGNPTQTQGQFYDAFHRDRAEWLCMHTSSEDGPNVGPLPDDEKLPSVEWVPPVHVPGLAMRGWVEQRRRILAPYQQNNEYLVRVRGDFPTSGASNVVALVHLEASISRYREELRRFGDDHAKWLVWLHESERRERLHVGVDVARFGDDANAVVLRRGRRVVGVERFSGADSIQAAGRVRSIVHALMTSREKARHGEKPMVKVDVIGVGAGVYDQLSEFSELDVLDVNVATTSDDEDKYPNLRSQLWFGVADFLANGGIVPDDRLLSSDVLSPRYSFDTRGRQKVEAKDQLKERLGRSPDTGDAFALAVYAAGSWSPGAFTLAGLTG